MSRAIVWFRNDLRIRDNEALYRAVEDFDEVVPIYVIDKSILQREAYGSAKTGAFRMAFVLKSLENLKRQLVGLGSNLIVEVGDPAAVVYKYVKKYAVDAVYAHKEATREEIEVEEDLKRSLDDTGVKFYWGHTLYHVNDLPFEYTAVPDVFTAFHKKCEKYAEIRPEFPAPAKITSPELKPDEIPTLTDLDLIPSGEDRKTPLFAGGEDAAWERLNHYFWKTEALSSYKYTRNGLLGMDYSSKFSPWLAAGCISPRSIYYAVKRYEDKVKKNVSTYWMVFELIWRDYFRYVALKYGDKLFYPGGIKGESSNWQDDNDRLEKWKRGETGIPFIDANMRELNTTGFMSNRGRQNVASFLVKDLHQDWRKGAAYFEEKLVDYDVTSNWGNWAYVAGVGNDPRENRYFNIMTQASRYDGKGEHVKHWIPELSELDQQHIHAPWTMSSAELSRFGLVDSIYANPVVVAEQWKL